MTRAFLVRHGETEWNRLGKFRGRADIPLNEKGIAQARRVAERLAHIHVKSIFTSPLARTLMTAREIASHHSLTPIAEEGLLDLAYGDWEGKTVAEVQAYDAAHYHEWMTHPDLVQIPRGETLESLRQRAFETLERLTPPQSDEPVVLVSHDMVGRILVCAVLGLPNDATWRIPQDNAALTIFERVAEGFILRTMNDTAHLDSLT